MSTLEHSTTSINFLSSGDEFTDSEVDSEIEFQLYSQVHYGVQTVSTSMEEQSGDATETDDKNEQSTSIYEQLTVISNEFEVLSECGSESSVEDWQIIDDSEQTRNDGMIINMLDNSKQDGDKSTEEQNTANADVSLWELTHHEDLQRLHPNKGGNVSRYYKESGKTRCKNCEEIGHNKANCPNPRKERKCYLCGEPGHIGKKCGAWMELREWPEKRTCTRCGRFGHRRSRCPDHWRKFHITTKEGQIMKSDWMANQKRYCSICATKGHLNYKCDSSERDYYTNVNSVKIYEYEDDNHEERMERKRNHSPEKDKNEHHNAKKSKPNMNERCGKNNWEKFHKKREKSPPRKPKNNELESRDRKILKSRKKKKRNDNIEFKKRTKNSEKNFNKNLQNRKNNLNRRVFWN